MSNVFDLVRSALQAAAGSGVFPDELSHKLGIEYKVVIETIQHMISEGIAMEEQHADKPRYFIKATEEEASQHQLSDLNGCPCFHCLKIERCGTRQPDSPVMCRSLEEWLISSESS